MIFVRVSINDTFLRLTFQTDPPGAPDGRVVLQFQSCLEESSGDPNKDLWSRFVTSQRFGSGGQTELTGWFVREFLGFRDGDFKQSGVNVVHITITIGVTKEEAAFVAGVTGYTITALCVFPCQ